MPKRIPTQVKILGHTKEHKSTPAQVAKLVDAGDSKSPAARRAGSSPALGTR